MASASALVEQRVGVFGRSPTDGVVGDGEVKPRLGDVTRVVGNSMVTPSPFSYWQQFCLRRGERAVMARKREIVSTQKRWQQGTFGDALGERFAALTSQALRSSKVAVNTRLPQRVCWSTRSPRRPLAQQPPSSSSGSRPFRTLEVVGCSSGHSENSRGLRRGVSDSGGPRSGDARRRRSWAALPTRACISVQIDASGTEPRSRRRSHPGSRRPLQPTSRRDAHSRDGSYARAIWLTVASKHAHR